MFSMTLSDGNKHYNWIKPPSCRRNENDDPRVNHLLEFYSEYVHIHPEQWEIASNIVNQVLGKIELHLREVVKLRFPGVSVGDFLPQGSASDGLKVCHPNEFDIGIPFCSENVQFSYVSDTFSKKWTEKGNPLAFTKLWVSKYGGKPSNNEGYYLKTTDAKEMFRLVLYESIAHINKDTKKISPSDVTVKANLQQSKSPAVEVEVYVTNPQLQDKLSTNRITIDIAPIFPMKDVGGTSEQWTTAYVVMKSPTVPVYCRTESGKTLQQDIYWKLNYDLAESRLFTTLINEHTERYILTFLT